MALAVLQNWSSEKKQTNVAANSSKRMKKAAEKEWAMGRIKWFARIWIIFVCLEKVGISKGGNLRIHGERKREDLRSPKRNSQTSSSSSSSSSRHYEIRLSLTKLCGVNKAPLKLLGSVCAALIRRR